MSRWSWPCSPARARVSSRARTIASMAGRCAPCSDPGPLFEERITIMSQETYRVIQWATGTVGKVALRHCIETPAFELAGVLVTNPEKVGKDAGALVDLPATGVLATDDVEKIIA